MPGFSYWFSGTALFLAVSFGFTVAVGLIGIKEMIPDKVFLIFLFAAVNLGLFAWYTAAKQEQDATLLRNTLASIEQRQQNITYGVIQIAPIVEALRQHQQALSESEQTKNLLGIIIVQYDKLQSGIQVQEQFTGAKKIDERLAAAEHIIRELKAILGNVQTKSTPQGTGLIIKTAPNTFRVTFAVPMYRPPDVTFHNVPTGAVPNIIEKSTIGLTVVFTPPTIPVDVFPAMEASAEL